MEKLWLIPSLITLAACQPRAASLDIRALCTDTVNEYAHARDAGDVERAKDLFTEEAVLTIFGKTQNGREEILAALAARADGATSRHMIGSVLITPTGPDTAKGESYVFLIADAKGNAPLPLTEKSLLAAGTYEDIFVVTDGVCRIKSRNVIIDFQQQ